MANGNEGPERLYVITDQRQTTEVTRAGGFVDMMEVYFVTRSNIEASVKIPVTLFEPDYVHDQVSAMAKRIEDVQAL